MTRTLYIVTAFLAGWGFYYFYSNTDFRQESKVEPSASSTPSGDSLPNIVLMGVGDMMLGSNYPSGDLLPPEGGKNLLREVAPVLRRADISFGNLEGVIMSAPGTPKHCNQPEYCYVFKSPDEYVEHFIEAGIDVVKIGRAHV